jgi:hypothetical protein
MSTKKLAILDIGITPLIKPFVKGIRKRYVFEKLQIAFSGSHIPWIPYFLLIAGGRIDFGTWTCKKVSGENT